MNDRAWKILVVDDIKVNVELLKIRLEREGYKVIPAFDGKEAWDLIQKTNPDLILTDVIMPEMDGYELCRYVKKSEKYRNVPVVLITSLASTEDKVKGLENGCDDFLPKPINDLELVARVRSLLRIKEYTDELKIKNIAFQNEIRLAAKVQKNILPQTPPLLDTLEIDFKYVPCYQVGGDFYYFTKFSDSRIGVFVADVVGHGIQAALITMILKTLLDKLVLEIDKPDELLSEINQQLIYTLGGKYTYVTAMWMIIDTDKLTIDYSSAGHPPAYLCRNGELIELKSKGMVLGLFEKIDFKCVQQKIKNDDTLLMYTDGVFEAESKSLELFGEERLEAILRENYLKSPSEINELILEKIENFVGSKKYNDDINLISIRIKNT